MTPQFYRTAVVVSLLLGAVFQAGCSQISLPPPVFVAHENAANPVWVGGPFPLYPLKIAGLEACTSVADLKVISGIGQDPYSTSLYLVCPAAKELAVAINYDPGTGQVVRAAATDIFRKAGSATVGEGAFAVVVDAVEGFAYVSNTLSNTVSVVDIRTNRTVATIGGFPAGSRPGGLAVMPGKLYVVLTATGKVSVVNTATRQISATIDVGQTPGRPSLSAGNRDLYVPNSGSGTVSVIATATDTVEFTIPSTRGTQAVAASKNGKFLFIGRTAAPGFEDIIYSALTYKADAGGAIENVPTAPSSYMEGLTAGSDSLGFAVVDASDGSPVVFWQAPILQQELADLLQFQLYEWTGRVLEPSVNSSLRATSVAVSEKARLKPRPGQCRLTIRTVGPGSIRVSPPPPADGFYPCDILSILNAEPEAGSEFDGWNVSTKKAGASAATAGAPKGIRSVIQEGITLPVTPKQDDTIIVVGTFRAPPLEVGSTANFRLRVETAPAGLQARIGTAGVYSPAPVVLTAPALSAQTISVTTPQFSAANGTGYAFSSWSTGATTPEITVQSLADITHTATFWPACYVLTLASAPAAAGTVTASPASGGLAGLPSNCYAPGTVVTLTAAGTGGATVQSWTGASGTGNTATVTMAAPVTATANFGTAANVNLTVATNPAGLETRIGTSGVFAPGPVTLPVAPNSTQTIAVSNPQYLAAARTGYSFTGWSTGATTPVTTVQPTANLTATASFRAACYELAINVLPAGSGTVTATQPVGVPAGLPANCYAPGTLVILTAAGTGGSTLQSWTGASGTGNVVSVVMGAPATVTANFGTASNVNLTLATNPAGLGVRIGAAGPFVPGPVTAPVPANQPQTISAADPQYLSSALTGYSFVSWSTGAAPASATTTVQPAANLTATATFRVACYALVVSVSPANGGTVTASPASGGLPGMPANCYAPGTVVTLTAAANEALDFYFDAEPTYRVTMNAPQTIPVTFIPYPAPKVRFVLDPNLSGFLPGNIVAARGRLENRDVAGAAGAPFKDVRITRVNWVATPAGQTVTNTTVLPLVVGDIAAGGVSGTVELRGNYSAGVADVRVCASGTAVSPLSGRLFTWADPNCP